VSIQAVEAVVAGAFARQKLVRTTIQGAEFPVQEWAELQARRNGRYGKIKLDPI